MSDDREDHTTSPVAWEGSVHHSDLHNTYVRPLLHSLTDPVDETAPSLDNHSSPQNRSSTDSPVVNGPNKSPTSYQPWRDNVQPITIERHDTLSTMNSGMLVEPSFDENVLRALCELDVSVSCFILLYILNFRYLWSSVACHCFSIASNKV